MANRQRGEFAVELDGKTKILRYDHNAIAELEGILDLDFMDIFKGPIGFRQHRAFVWAGLLHGDELLSIRRVGEWLTPLISEPEQYNSVISAALNAFNAVFPERKEQPVDGEKKMEKKVGTGKT